MADDLLAYFAGVLSGIFLLLTLSSLWIASCEQRTQGECHITVSVTEGAIQ